MGLGELQNLCNVKNGQAWELDSMVDGSLSSHNSMVDEMMEKILDDESLTECNNNVKRFSPSNDLVLSELSPWSEDVFHNSFDGHSYTRPTCHIDDSLISPTKSYMPINVNLSDCDINLGSLDHSNLLKLAALNMESPSEMPFNEPTFYNQSSPCYPSQSPDSPTRTSYFSRNLTSQNVSSMQSASQLLYENHDPYHHLQLPSQQVMQVSTLGSISDESSNILINRDFKSAQHPSVSHLRNTCSACGSSIQNITSSGFNDKTNGMEQHQCNDCAERDRSNNNTLMLDLKKSTSNNHYQTDFHHEQFSNVSSNIDHRTYQNKFHVPDSNLLNETSFLLCHNNNNEIPSKQTFSHKNHSDDQTFHYKYKQHSNLCNVPHIPLDPTFPSLNRSLLSPDMSTAVGGSAFLLPPEANMMSDCDLPGMAGCYLLNLRSAR